MPEFGGDSTWVHDPTPLKTNSNGGGGKEGEEDTVVMSVILSWDNYLVPFVPFFDRNIELFAPSFDPLPAT